MSVATLEPRARWDINSVITVLDAARTETGELLIDLIQSSPVLIVFLRHAGCTFCREAVADISSRRVEIESSGTCIVLVHMGDRREMESLLARYGLSDLDRICDPAQELYRAFGLRKGTWNQLFGLKVWVRGFMAGIVRGHGVGRPVADATQMPGVFFLDQGVIAAAYRHRSAADRPCYTELCDPPEAR